MVDKRHTQQRSGSPQGNPDAAHPSNPSPPATELGGVPAVWQGGEVASHFAPNAIAQQKAELWYPQVLTIPAGSTVNVSADGIPARWLVSLASAGTVTVYTIANGAGVGLPLYAQGVTLRLPGTNPQLSLQNTGNATATVVVIATSGYQPIEALGYVSGASASSGGAGSNVTIVGPVNGSGFVEVAQQGAVAVTGVFWQATQPVSGTFWQATQPVSGAFWQATQPVSGTVFGQAVQGALTDRSGTVTTGGTAQALAVANGSRKYFIIQNLHATEVLWVNFTATAVQAEPSIQIPAAGGALVMESSYVSTESISVIAATTGHAWTAKEG